jgi:hypothetical protein
VKKFLIPLLGIFVLASASVSAEGDKTPPSDGAKKAAKKAKKEAMAFDPQTYTCQQFLEDFNKEEVTDKFGIAVIWGHGYFSSAYGSDAMGPLTEKAAAEVIQYFVEYCEENKPVALSRAAYMIAEEDEEE